MHKPSNSPLPTGEGLGVRGFIQFGWGFYLWLGISAIVILLDQISKAAITSHFVHGESLPVTSFFNLVLAHNTGAAFSFLSEAGGMQRWLFTAIAVIASVWIAWLLHKHHAQKLFSLALALILGGAIGNVIDRTTYGYVVDFLDFYWNGYHFAAFNLADSAITGGAILLILDSLIGKKDGTVTR